MHHVVKIKRKKTTTTLECVECRYFEILHDKQRLLRQNKIIEDRVKNKYSVNKQKHEDAVKRKAD